MRISTPRASGDPEQFARTGMTTGGVESVRLAGVAETAWETVETFDASLRLDVDGTTILADDREAVFEYGYTSADEGTGFGLAIVRGIVDAHGWSVRITEGTDGGARFEIARGSPERT